MSLAKLSDLLNKSTDGDYLIGLFECWNYESAIAIVSAAEKINCPMVLFTGKPAVDLLGMKNLSKMMLDLASKSSVPITCHIEAVNNYEMLLEAIRYGFPSVLYDGSELLLEKNINNTKKIVEIAHAQGVEVEAQIGSMPFSKSGLGYENIKFDKHKTKIEEAEFFVKETNIDILAPNIGNVHGLHKQKIPCIDIELANDLSKRTGLPITLHGGTGIPDKIIEKAKKSKLAGMYLATNLFETFRRCVRNNIEKESGYGSYARIALHCKNELEKHIISKFELLESNKFFI